MRAQEKSIKGFTILELIVVIVIIGVISAAAYPSFSSWRKEREVRGAAIEIKNLFTNINSQVQRGMYAFVQVEVVEDSTNQILTITSKGMHLNTMLQRARNEDGWTTSMDIRCSSTQPWDDEGSPTNRRLEVSQLVYDEITTNFTGSDLQGTVCFSKDGTYYSYSEPLEIDSFFYICGRSPTNTSCNVSGAGVPDAGLDNVFAINWSRFGEVTLEKWSKTKEDWVLQ